MKIVRRISLFLLSLCAVIIARLIEIWLILILLPHDTSVVFARIVICATFTFSAVLLLFYKNRAVKFAQKRSYEINLSKIINIDLTLIFCFVTAVVWIYQGGLNVVFSENFVMSFVLNLLPIIIYWLITGVVWWSKRVKYKK